MTINPFHPRIRADVERAVFGWYEASALAADSAVGPRHDGPVPSDDAMPRRLGGTYAGHERRQSHGEEARRHRHEGLRDPRQRHGKTRASIYIYAYMCIIRYRFVLYIYIND